MEYKEIVKKLKEFIPEKVPYGELVGASWHYTGKGEMVYKEPEHYLMEQAAVAIEELLTKLENAEWERDSAIRDLTENGANCIYCKHYIGNYKCGNEEPCGVNNNFEWRGAGDI